jgi:RHS repeat-associated protein
MIDAEIQNGQITKRYIFINLRPVVVIEYENDTNSDQNSHKNDSASGSKYADYKPKSTEIYAIHTDHLGTPQAITDSQQAVVWRADYATFGKATVQARVVDGSSKTARASFGIISTANAANEKEAKPFEFNLRFAGQYEDTESGYHYNWHRYYDPSTGRYLTPDPIGLAGGLNGYGYAGQDPMGAVDPWGLKVYVTGHNISPTSSWHSALLLVPDDQAAFANKPGYIFGGASDGVANGKWYQVVSAGPSRGWNLIEPGKLVDERNRSTDLPSKNIVLGEVRTSTPLKYSNFCRSTAPTDTELVNYLSKMPDSYLDGADYGYPSNLSSTGTLSPGTYNSNSYIAGILNHIGVNFTLPADNRFPGFNQPLPDSSYNLFAF